MRFSAPGSTANLGAGFDCLAIAVASRFEVSDTPDDGLRELEPTHPASVAYERAGGASRRLWGRGSLPPGRGLGFSGATRVAGAALAIASRSDERAERSSVARRAFEVAAELEGHPENAAASAFGGFVVCRGDVVATPEVRSVPTLALVVWWPERTTSTDQSRRGLPDTVTLSDAAYNIGSAALMVAGLITRDRSLIAAGTDDRLHESARLAVASPSAAVLSACRAHPAVWAAWLSGSGPTIAALVASDDAAAFAHELASDGTIRVLDLDDQGVFDCTE